MEDKQLQQELQFSKLQQQKQSKAAELVGTVVHACNPRFGMQTQRKITC